METTPNILCGEKHNYKDIATQKNIIAFSKLSAKRDTYCPSIHI